MRKDRIEWLSGSDRLGEHRLTPESPTRRFVARCCNAPIALEFTKGHWLSVYSDRIAAEQRPAAEMRTIIGDRHEGRSEEHTSELQSLMRISYAVFCLKKKNKKQ